MHTKSEVAKKYGKNVIIKEVGKPKRRKEAREARNKALKIKMSEVLGE